MNVTIYHNSRCSNSRGALALIEQAGITPTIVDYVNQPPSRATLATLLKQMRLKPIELMRTKEPLFAELHLATASDEALLDAMAAHPTLINRPIVVTDTAAALCRPPEKVLALLEE